MCTSSRLSAWPSLILAAALATTPAGAQGSGWRFVAPDGARAWFAVMAGAHASGPGPLPYYRPRYAAPLPDSIGRTLERDASYEVLHFLPLYLPPGDAPLVAATLRAAASGRVPVRGQPTAFASAALADVLPRPDQRAVLAALALVVERAAAALPPSPSLVAMQRRWDEAFAPRLAPYLEAQGLRSGVVLLSEALGPEGRIFTGRADDPADNLAAVAYLPPAADGDASLFALVRELCFPLVTRLASRGADDRSNREQQAWRASFGAVRCGAYLTARALPELAEAYRQQWLSFARRSPTTDPLAFQEAFPIDPPLDHAIRTELARAVPPQRSGRGALHPALLSRQH